MFWIFLLAFMALQLLGTYLGFSGYELWVFTWLNVLILFMPSLFRDLRKARAAIINAAPETEEISEAQRSLFPPARGPTSP